MAFSADKQRQQLHTTTMYCAATAAPPPSPSVQGKSQHVTAGAAADALSRLLHRLPPNLSLPTRRSSATSAFLPAISLADTNSADLLMSTSSEKGFFELISHDVPSQLAHSAESEAFSLFDLSKYEKELNFPRNRPLGFEDNENGNGDLFWLEATCFSDSKELRLASLHELTRALEKLGLEIVEKLSTVMGFENPIGMDPTRFRSIMLLHGSSQKDIPVISGGSYPYILGLQYQIRSQKYYVLGDLGWSIVSPQVDSIMVTIGDIAQVWTNGKLKKVRGRPVRCLEEDINTSRCVSMTLLLTLPLETNVSTLIPKAVPCCHAYEQNIREEEDEQNHGSIVEKEERLFVPFVFEDYARRVYHEPLLLKDPLDRYRI
ncbi:hypothetical protein K2173_005016 [Erythroxylum novogranatense]|uniref:Uncharacterized protein n=1 Tax=Erythroxylum novogranatense TaxID=1862640 RepID=A0AAV8TBA1_9ROSI|nr:hypothetical protein K2173_005016 [Erythroxylum novogranatense]